jgi:hypothetical protein
MTPSAAFAQPAAAQAAGPHAAAAQAATAGLADRRAPDPPDIVGYTVPEAEKALLAWNPNVSIDYVPSLKELPAGFTVDTVLVASSHLASAADLTAHNPRVVVNLGTKVPDLNGMTTVDAEKALAAVDMQSAAGRLRLAPDWVVVGQRPAAGRVAPFGSLVTLLETAPPGAVTTPSGLPAIPPIVAPPPPAPRLSLVAVSAIAGGSLLLLILAVLALASLARASRRRRRAAPAERVEVYGFPGQVVGPCLTVLSPGGTSPVDRSVSVRLEPHPDPGAVRLLERNQAEREQQ